MNEENLDKLEEITSNLCMRLNILHNALKDCDWSELDICAVSCFVEDIYNQSKELGNIF